MSGFKSDRPVRERAGRSRCLTIAARCFVATARELVRSALSNVYGIRFLFGLTVARFQRTSTQPEEAYSGSLRIAVCPYRGSGLPWTRGPVRSGDSLRLICRLFRMSDALTSGSHAHRYHGLARMRWRSRRWTLCAWEGIQLRRHRRRRVESVAADHLSSSVRPRRFWLLSRIGCAR